MFTRDHKALLPGVDRSLLIVCRYALFCLAGCALMLAQGPGQAPNSLPANLPDSSSIETAGAGLGTYNVQQSIELGGRITNVTGSVPMYDTLVNQQSGPRVLDQTLFMQSTDGSGVLFDTLSMDSFGWGGDPNNALRLRVSKHGWYNFSGSFRRDQNYFNYDLLANPLNPTTAPAGLPVIPVDNSPHSYYLRRRMYDFNLTLLPQHKFSFTLEYSRNRNEGPSFSSYHGGTDALLGQGWSTTNNEFRVAGSWRITPKTTLTYTQMFQFFTNDRSYSLANFATFLLPNGSPVEFGLPWLNSNSPCKTPLIAGVANPVCSGFLSYSRGQRYRNFLPTEQINLTSRALRNVEFTGRFAYSNADASTPQYELFNGLDTRTGLRAWNTNGSEASARWVSNEGDAGVTIYLGRNARIVDSFRFFRYDVPGYLYNIENNFFSPVTVAAPGSLLAPPASGSPVTHVASSPADYMNDFYSRFIKQSTKTNLLQLQYDLGRHAGFRIGFDYRNIFDGHRWISTALDELYLPILPNRGNCAGLTLNPDGSCTFTGLFDSEDEPVTINQYWAIAGVWFRPTPNLRADAEVRFMSADNFLTRIDPRHQQQYRANVSYTPRAWMTLGANFNILQQRDPTQDFGFFGHYRTYGITATLMPSDRFALDFAYNYSDTQQNANVCYTGSYVVAGSGTCTNDPLLVETLGNYANQTQYMNANVRFTPIKRVTAVVGYSLVSVDGSTLLLNPLQPLGPLSYNYHQPLASVGVQVAKRIELRTGWNYYQYAENSFIGPTLPRYFHANNTTVSLKYAF